MGTNENIGMKKSTCLYLDHGVVETAKQLGLNVSKVCEKALVEAISRLKEPKQATGIQARSALRVGAGIRTRRQAPQACGPSGYLTMHA